MRLRRWPGRKGKHSQILDFRSAILNMSDLGITLRAIKLKGHIGSDRKLEITESLVGLPEGDVEIILLYPQNGPDRKSERPSPLTWPTLDGGRYLGGTSRREEIYSNDAR